MNTIQSIWFGYFLIHIPISLMVDFQAILSAEYFHSSLRWLVNDWYWENFQDFLMKDPPIWFKSLVWVELIVQMPFFIYAVLALLNRWRSFRWAAFAYSIHLLTVMIPILSEVIFSSIAQQFKLRLYLVYGLWVAMPLWIAIYTWFWDPFAVPQALRPFSPTKKSK